ncbi:MAG TPA: GNAT family N-acetyltransferase [Bacteroidales bacterium]|nr:GNAT family N-acetyltransferase [Bacteroidales bacterium]
MLSTSRLNILPLSYSELFRYLTARDQLAWDLDFIPFDYPMECTEERAIRFERLPKIKNNPDKYYYYTIWLIIHKFSKKMIGSICMHGIPDKKGQVEIGYSTGPEFRNQGFMTETLKVFIDWTGKRRDIRAIVAETDVDNCASMKVLEKCGFVITEEVEGKVYWRLPVKKRKQKKLFFPALMISASFSNLIPEIVSSF